MSIILLLLTLPLTLSQPSPSGMSNIELSALFEVMTSLLADQTWPQLHPHPCSDTPWPGIQCELFQSLDPYLHVTKLHIGPDILSPPCKPAAKLTSTLLKLPHLRSLSLFNCFVSTKFTLPPSLFTNSSVLEQLALKSNPNLSGEIPSTLSLISTLRVLSLSQNNISGSIPSELGRLAHLHQLDLSFNRLTGAIPDLGGASSVTILDLSFNMLQYQIPVSLGNLNLLQKLDLSSNNLSGTVPATLGRLHDLVLLDLSWNSLTGPLPAAMAGLTELEYLMMEGNPIGTTIPEFVGALSKLAVLGFSGCGFVGAIPSFFGGLDNLTAVSLDKNRLNGSIPKVLGGLPKLGQLNLSQNELSGDIGLSAEFVRRLGWRLDLRDNKGLCADPNISVIWQTPPCLVAGANSGDTYGGVGLGLESSGSIYLTLNMMSLGLFVFLIGL